MTLETQVGSRRYSVVREVPGDAQIYYVWSPTLFYDHGYVYEVESQLAHYSAPGHKGIWMFHCCHLFSTRPTEWLPNLHGICRHFKRRLSTVEFQQTSRQIFRRPKIPDDAMEPPPGNSRETIYPAYYHKIVPT